MFVAERGLATSPQVIVNLFHRWYRNLSFEGYSSHSGRRTFITNAARRVSTVGGSLTDVQVSAQHPTFGLRSVTSNKARRPMQRSPSRFNEQVQKRPGNNPNTVRP